MKNEKSNKKNKKRNSCDTNDFLSLVGQNTTFPCKILAHRT
jgi:hypothetical protein